jgi:hypothetical protein
MSRSVVDACGCAVCQTEPSDENASTRALHHQMNLFLSRLNEQQRRWYAALESKRFGHGGDRQLSRLTSLSEKTIRKGRRELDGELATCPVDRIRTPGGGRPAVEVRDPAVESTLEEIVVPETAGDPQSRAKYKRSSLQSERSTRRGGASGQSPECGAPPSEARLFAEGECEAQGGEGIPPERDAQFRYIEQQKRDFLEAGDPVVSVDTKKKELIGDFKNAGAAWCKEPEAVLTHDFPQDSLGKAIPYGVYNLNHNDGYVRVGDCFDTPRFAVESIVGWGVLGGTEAVPPCGAAPDPGGLWRIEQLPLAGVEGAAPGAARGSVGPGGHSLSLPHGLLQVESDRAPALQPHQPELGGQAATHLRDPDRLPAGHEYTHRTPGHGRPMPG